MVSTFEETCLEAAALQHISGDQKTVLSSHLHHCQRSATPQYGMITLHESLMGRRKIPNRAHHQWICLTICHCPQQYQLQSTLPSCDCSRPSVPSTSRFPSPELLLCIKQWDQLPLFSGLREGPPFPARLRSRSTKFEVRSLIRVYGTGQPARIGQSTITGLDQLVDWTGGLTFFARFDPGNQYTCFSSTVKTIKLGILHATTCDNVNLRITQACRMHMPLLLSSVSHSIHNQQPLFQASLTSPDPMRNRVWPRETNFKWQDFGPEPTQRQLDSEKNSLCRVQQDSHARECTRLGIMQYEDPQGMQLKSQLLAKLTDN